MDHKVREDYVPQLDDCLGGRKVKSSSLDHPPDSQPQIGLRLLVRRPLQFRELQESDQRSMKMKDPSRHGGSEHECRLVERSHGGGKSMLYLYQRVEENHLLHRVLSFSWTHSKCPKET